MQFEFFIARRIQITYHRNITFQRYFSTRQTVNSRLSHPDHEGKICRNIIT